MIKRYVLLYFIVFTIPVLLGLVAWQSVRYAKLDKGLRRLEATQEDWLESNKKLVAGIAVLSSSSRIEQVAVYDLGLTKMQPEDVLAVSIEGGMDR